MISAAGVVNVAAGFAEPALPNPPNAAWGTQPQAGDAARMKLVGVAAAVGTERYRTRDAQRGAQSHRELPVRHVRCPHRRWDAAQASQDSVGGRPGGGDVRLAAVAPHPRDWVGGS